MSDKEDIKEKVKPLDKDVKSLGIFKWHGWGSPIGLGIFIVSCAIAVLLLAWAGSLYVK
jgi:hypothetical protein